jgi:hypothetical protein
VRKKKEKEKEQGRAKGSAVSFREKAYYGGAKKRTSS